MPVKLRVNRSTFYDIRKRILDCGDPQELDRFWSPWQTGHPGPDGGIDLNGVILVVDEAEDVKSSE